MPEEQYCGIGLISGHRFLNSRFNGLVIQTVGPGSPAEKAGLVAGDVVTMTREEGGEWKRVDFRGLNIRGPADTSVDLRIEHDGEKREVLGIVRSGIVVENQQTVRTSREGCDLVVSELGSLAPNAPSVPQVSRQRG